MGYSRIILDELPPIVNTVIGQRHLPLSAEQMDPDGYRSDSSYECSSQFIFKSESDDGSQISGSTYNIANKAIEDEICRICGDRASGYHYNALSCEGCKGFFRRSITRGAVYHCKYGSKCEMDMWMRRKCQACRLRRCREMGMKEECLLSDEQCKARDARRKAKKKASIKRHTAPIQSPLLPDSNTYSARNDMVTCVATAIGVTVTELPPCTIVNADPLPHLKQENQQLIEKLVRIQEVYELPDEDDIKNATIIDPNNPKKEASADAFWTQIAEFTALVTQLVINFSKELPGFTALMKEDQIVLLKASTCEVMLIRSARRYDYDTRSIIMANNMPLTLEIMKGLGMGVYADLMFEFCHRLTGIGLDNAEFALLTAISIFSERPGLREPNRVEKVQELYITALSEYECIKRLKGGTMVGKLLWKLTDLRTINVEHSKMILRVQVDKTSLPPLLQEIFSLNEQETASSNR